jgi:hypothetical protein
LFGIHFKDYFNGLLTQPAQFVVDNRQELLAAWGSPDSIWDRMRVTSVTGLAFKDKANAPDYSNCVVQKHPAAGSVDAC